MTPPTPAQIATRIASALTPSFPSRTAASPDLVQALDIHLDSRERVALDSDGLANDFVGSGHFIVSETRGGSGFFDPPRTSFRSKMFTYFLRDSGGLLLREINPRQNLNPTSGLAEVPEVHVPFPTRGQRSERSATLEEAQDWAERRSQQNPISIFVGNIDSRPGDEIEFLIRGIESLGIVNIVGDLLP